MDTSGGAANLPTAQPHKALKVLCGEGADLQLESRGKSPLEARIQITGRGWTHPQIEAITEYGDGLIEMVSNALVPHVMRPADRVIDWRVCGCRRGMAPSDSASRHEHSAATLLSEFQQTFPERSWRPSRTP